MIVKIKDIVMSEFDSNTQLLIFENDLGVNKHIVFTPQVQKYIGYKPVKIGSKVLVVKSKRGDNFVYLLKKVFEDGE